MASSVSSLKKKLNVIKSHYLTVMALYAVFYSSSLFHLKWFLIEKNHIPIFRGISPQFFDVIIHISHNAWLNILCNHALELLLPARKTWYNVRVDIIHGRNKTVSSAMLIYNNDLSHCKISATISMIFMVSFSSLFIF